FILFPMVGIHRLQTRLRFFSKTRFIHHYPAVVFLPGRHDPFIIAVLNHALNRRAAPVHQEFHAFNWRMQNHPCAMKPSSKPNFRRRRPSEAMDLPLPRQYMKYDALACIRLPDGHAVSSIYGPISTAPTGFCRNRRRYSASLY
ncbi:MAG: hypothetical protein IKP58_03630, partial [Victivallales bacterium]|nr:hypothetical protein [Victivallales bacterium]